MKQIFLVLVFTFSFISVFANNEIDSLLQKLDSAIAQSKQYDAQKLAGINSLKEQLKTPSLSFEQIYSINQLIIEEYRVYNFDSTLHYIEQNLLLCKKYENTTLLNETHLFLARLLAKSGRYKEAMDILKGINRNNVNTNLLADYFNCYREAYLEMSLHATLIVNRNNYKRLTKIYADSLLTILDPDTELYLSVKERLFRDAGQVDSAMALNTKRLLMVKMGTQVYSIVTYERFRLFDMLQDNKMQKKYLILSAISDIKAAIKDNASLTALALRLHDEQYIDHAHRYINFAYNDAAFYNSKLRFLVISNIFPLITDAYDLQNEKQKTTLKNYLSTITILALILAIAIAYIYKQLKNLSKARNELRKANSQLKALNNNLQDANLQLNDLNKELSESNHVKEQYIANFLKICSDYIDKLDAYRKMVNKQIIAKKTKELFEMTKSTRIIDAEVKAFYDTFDNTFLNIYPRFVSELNSLLREDEKIVVKDGELLNTELRIYALIRLGITDSSKIAKLLRYSVNTIYNYRVKIKNKAAVERDDFEGFVKRINAFVD